MWHEKVIHLLLKKITNSERKNTKIFCNKFFKQLREIIFTEENDPHFQFTLGLIEKLFLKFVDQKNGSVSLEVFARYLFGLAVIYAKIEFDYPVWTSAFLPLLKDPWIVKILNIKQDIKHNQERLESGEREFRVRKIDENEPDIVATKLDLATQCEILVIQGLEYSVFADLDGQFKVDYQTLQSIFSWINSWPSMSRFFAQAAPLVDAESDFSLFAKEAYLLAAENQKQVTTKHYEGHFILRMEELAQLAAAYKDDLTKSDSYSKTRALHMQLVLAGFAYFLKPDCRTYCQFKTTAINSLRAYQREAHDDVALNLLLNRMFFAVLSLGQYQLGLVKDENLLVEEEQNYLLELNSFYCSYDKDCIPSAGLFRQLTSMWADYLQHKDLINYFMIKKVALMLFDHLRELINYPEGVTVLDKLEFALLGLELGYRNRLKETEIEEEIAFFNSHLLLARKIAETKLALMRVKDDRADTEVGIMEDLSFRLDDAWKDYFSTDREDPDFDWLLWEIDQAIAEAKSNTVDLWSTEIKKLEQLRENLGQTCTRSSEPVFNKDEKDFLDQLSSFIAICNAYLRSDEACHAPYAGHIDALAARISTSASIYFEFKTSANFRTFKLVLIETIDSHLPKLAGEFFYELQKLKQKLKTLNPPECVYINGQNHLIFSVDKTQNEDDKDQVLGVERAEI